VPEASSVDDDEDGEKEEEEDDDEEGVDVEAEQPPPPPPRVTGEVSGQIYNGKMVCDDMINHVAYHILHASERGEHFEVPPKLTEEEQLEVAVIVSTEEEKRAFAGYYDTLALSVELPPPPWPLRMPPRPRRNARNEPWDAWPVAAPPTIGWPPPPLPGPPPSPMAAQPWPRAPFIDLSGDDDDDNGLA
jgi:hypothetical protein